jgi:hypothetical protein
MARDPPPPAGTGQRDEFHHPQPNAVWQSDPSTGMTGLQ